MKIRRIYFIVLVLVLIFIFLLYFYPLRGVEKEEQKYEWEKYNKILYVLFDLCKNETIKFKEYGVLEFEEELVYMDGEGNYSIVLISKENKEILDYNFDINFLLHLDIFDMETGGLKGIIVDTECKEIYLKLPYIRDINSLKVLHLNSTIYELDFCNYNGICEKNNKTNENHDLCPSDCQS